jgi:hypothetical protein
MDVGKKADAGDLEYLFKSLSIEAGISSAHNEFWVTIDKNRVSPLLPQHVSRFIDKLETFSFIRY